MPPSLDGLLAPSQLYIVLAVTVATCGWLARPSKNPVALRMVEPAFLFIVFQVAQIALHGYIAEPWALVMHVVTLVLYLPLTFNLIMRGWLAEIETDPDMPSMDAPVDASVL